MLFFSSFILVFPASSPLLPDSSLRLELRLPSLPLEELVLREDVEESRMVTEELRMLPSGLKML